MNQTTLNGATGVSSLGNPSTNQPLPLNPQASQSPNMSHTKGVQNKQLQGTPKQEPNQDDYSPKNLKEINQSRNTLNKGNADSFMTHNQNLEASRAKRQNNHIHYSFGEAPFGELNHHHHNGQQQFPSRSPVAAHFESENRYQILQQQANSQVAGVGTTTSEGQPTVVGQNQAPKNINREQSLLNYDRETITNSNSTVLIKPGEPADVAQKPLQDPEQKVTQNQNNVATGPTNDNQKLISKERKSEISIHSIQNTFQMPATPDGGHSNNVFQTSVLPSQNQFNNGQGDLVTPHLPSSRKPFDNGPQESNNSQPNTRDLQTANLGGSLEAETSSKVQTTVYPNQQGFPQNNVERQQYLDQVTSSEHLLQVQQAHGQVSSQNLQNTQMAVQKTEQMVTNIRLRQSQENLSTGYAQQDEKLALSYNTSGANTIQTRQVSHVPDTIRQEMVKKGFRPSSQQNDQFEYESDTVEKYEMISNEFNFEEVRTGERFGIKKYRDCLYRGQLAQNKKFREGLGVLVYESGRIYEGEWEMNKRHGRGYEMFANGNMYHGSYKEGKAHGKGVYQWQNGEVYDGEWVGGVKHGYGVWKGTNGESYIGQWHQGKAQGYGVHVWGNGDKYEGEWFGCLRHGNGSDFFANGDCYVGQYAQGKPEGFGQYKWANGSSYTGQFEGGLKHGHGKWKKRQADEKGQVRCNSYEGMYKNDKKHGKGVFQWESGNRYAGQYLNDERHGFGVMEWTDGSKYMGTWLDGIQHGIGVMIFPDGVKRAGIFEDNIFKESVKKSEQIEEYRDVLSDECIEILEELMVNKQQSRTDMLAPSKKSLKNLKKKQQSMAGLQVEDVRSSVKRSTPGGDANETQEDFQKQLPSSSQMMSSQAISSGLMSKTALVRTSSKLRDKKGSVESMRSDHKSLVNQKMHPAEVEDKNMTMQRGKFMNHHTTSKAIQSEAKPKPKSRPQKKEATNQRKPSIVSLPPTAPTPPQQQKTAKDKTPKAGGIQSKPRPNPVQIQHNSRPFFEKQNTVPTPPKPPIPGKTIEVQTDLSMLTMRQYEHSEHGRTATDQQRKWIKSTVQEEEDQRERNEVHQEQQDLASNKQTNTQHGSPSLYRTTPFEEVLSKPQFENTRHQKEILGSENPNEDTESEWNRNSSIMGHPPTQGQMKRTNQFRGDLRARISAGNNQSQNTVQGESISSKNNNHPRAEEIGLKGPDYFQNVAQQNFSRQDQHPYSRQEQYSRMPQKISRTVGGSKQPIRNAQERAEVSKLMSLPHHKTKFGGLADHSNERASSKRPPRGTQASKRPIARDQSVNQSRQGELKQNYLPSRGPHQQQRASKQKLTPISPNNFAGMKGKNRSRQNFFEKISTQIQERGNPLQRVQLHESIYQSKKQGQQNVGDLYLNQESGALDRQPFNTQELPPGPDSDLQQETGSYEIRDQAPSTFDLYKQNASFQAQNFAQQDSRLRQQVFNDQDPSNLRDKNPQSYQNVPEMSQGIIRRRDRKQNEGSLATQKKTSLYGVEDTPLVHPNMQDYATQVQQSQQNPYPKVNNPNISSTGQQVRNNFIRDQIQEQEKFQSQNQFRQAPQPQNNISSSQHQQQKPTLSHFENQESQARRDQVKREYALEEVGARTNYFRPPINRTSNQHKHVPHHQGIYLPRMASAERPGFPHRHNRPADDMLSMSPQEKDSSHMSALGTGGPPIPSGHLSNAFGFDKSFQKQYGQNELSEDRQLESRIRNDQESQQHRQIQKQTEPIVQQETELDELEGENPQKSLALANSQTSSSKTLRYNDFELIHKGISASEMANYQLNLGGESQEKQSRSVSRQDLKLSQASSIDYDHEQLSYPEIHLTKANKDLDPDFGKNVRKEKQRVNQKRQSVPRPLPLRQDQDTTIQQQYQNMTTNASRQNRTHSLETPVVAPQIQSQNDNPFDANREQVASFEAQQRQREADRNLMNSNDTQLADHTIGLQQAGIDVSGTTSRQNHQANQILNNDGYLSSGNMHQNMRRVQRSVPMQFDRSQKSKISVNQNRLFYPEEHRNLSNSIVERSTRIRKLSPDQQRFYAHQANLVRVSPSVRGISHGQQNHHQMMIMPKKKRLRNVNGPTNMIGSHQSIHASARRDLAGPYAQNLRRPKLYEARGGQKIAIKNNLQAAMQQKQSHEGQQVHQSSNPLTQMSSKRGQGVVVSGGERDQSQLLNLGFQSDTSQRMKNNQTIVGRLRNSNSRQRNGQFLGLDARGDKFSNRVGAQTQIEQQMSSNFVVPIPGVKNSFQNYENLLPGGIGAGQQQEQRYSQVHKTLVSQGVNVNNTSSNGGPPKRVWVPYNKKMKLKGIQQNMLSGSGGIGIGQQKASGNKLHSSQEEFPIHQGLYVHST